MTWPGWRPDKTMPDDSWVLRPGYFDETRLLRIRRSQPCFAAGDRLEQSIGAAQQLAAVLVGVAIRVGRIQGPEPPLAVVADHDSAKILHANPRWPPARWALLYEISWTGHARTSCCQSAIRLRPISCHLAKLLSSVRAKNRRCSSSGERAQDSEATCPVLPRIDHTPASRNGIVGKM